MSKISKSKTNYVKQMYEQLMLAFGWLNTVFLQHLVKKYFQNYQHKTWTVVDRYATYELRVFHGTTKLVIQDYVHTFLASTLR